MVPSPEGGSCSQARGMGALGLTMATLGPAHSEEQGPRQEGVLTTWGKGATPQLGHVCVPPQATWLLPTAHGYSSDVRGLHLQTQVAGSCLGFPPLMINQVGPPSPPSGPARSQM